MAIAKMQNEDACRFRRSAGKNHARLTGLAALVVGGLLLTGCGAKPEKVLMSYIDNMAGGKYEAATKLVYGDDAEVVQAQTALVEFTKTSPEESVFTRCDWTVSKDAALKKMAETVIQQGAHQDPEMAEVFKDCEIVVTVGADKKDNSVQKKIIWLVKANKVIPIPIPFGD